MSPFIIFKIWHNRNAQTNISKRFFIQVANSAYFAVICLVNLGLAWVSPEPDLPLPSLGIARDIKPNLPLEPNDNGNLYAPFRIFCQRAYARYPIFVQRAYARSPLFPSAGVTPDLMKYARSPTFGQRAYARSPFFRQRAYARCHKVRGRDNLQY